MKSSRTFLALAVLGLAAACTAAEPTSPSAGAGRPHTSAYGGSGYGTPSDTTPPPPNPDGES
ncbi:MAG TPA: hypothetical protein VGR37_03015 [Longimicrobiaceae bacterium]|nr:hypothetical protein [Longimicrobiaceae bacterium]